MISWDAYLQKVDQVIIRDTLWSLLLVGVLPERHTITSGNSSNPPGSSTKAIARYGGDLRNCLNSCPPASAMAQAHIAVPTIASLFIMSPGLLTCVSAELLRHQQ